MKKLFRAIFWTTAIFLLVGSLIMGLGSLLNSYHEAAVYFLFAVIFAAFAMIIYQFFEDQEKAKRNEDYKKIRTEINKINEG